MKKRILALLLAALLALTACGTAAPAGEAAEPEHTKILTPPQEAEMYLPVMEAKLSAIQGAAMSSTAGYLYDLGGDENRELMLFAPKDSGATVEVTVYTPGEDAPEQIIEPVTISSVENEGACSISVVEKDGVIWLEVIVDDRAQSLFPEVDDVTNWPAGDRSLRYDEQRCTYYRMVDGALVPDAEMRCHYVEYKRPQESDDAYQLAEQFSSFTIDGAAVSREEYNAFFESFAFVSQPYYLDFMRPEDGNLGDAPPLIDLVNELRETAGEDPLETPAPEETEEPEPEETAEPTPAPEATPAPAAFPYSDADLQRIFNNYIHSQGWEELNALLKPAGSDDPNVKTYLIYLPADNGDGYRNAGFINFNMTTLRADWWWPGTDNAWFNIPDFDY